MAEIIDCVDRMIQFKRRVPGAEFDLKPTRSLPASRAATNRSAL